MHVKTLWRVLSIYLPASLFWLVDAGRMPFHTHKGAQGDTSLAAEKEAQALSISGGSGLGRPFQELADV